MPPNQALPVRKQRGRQARLVQKNASRSRKPENVINTIFYLMILNLNERGTLSMACRGFVYFESNLLELVLLSIC